MTDGETLDAIRKAIDLIRDNRISDRCPPHLVHPKYAGWVLAGMDDTEAIVRCANLCGWAAPMRPKP